MSNSTVLDFITAFVQGTLGKKTRHGNWSLREDFKGNQVLVHRTKNQNAYHWPHEEFNYHLMAYRFTDGTLIGNGNRMRLVRSWGGFDDGDATNHLQKTLMEMGATLIPFTLFTESNLPIGEFKWVCKPVPETLLRDKFNRHDNREEWNRVTQRYEKLKPELIEQHFSGPCIFKVFERYFMFDIDRKEYDVGKVFNPFIVELPEPAKDIKQGYRLLKPKEVADSEASKIPVERQGEFFFIFQEDEKPEMPELSEEEIRIIKFPPSKAGFFMERPDIQKTTYMEWQALPDASTDVEKEYNDALQKYLTVRARLRSILDGPVELDDRGSHKANHGLVMPDGSIIVTGTISHRNREHVDLILKGWWKAVKNTAKRSITIQGDVD